MYFHYYCRDLCTCTCKHSLLSLYNVTSMYVFRAHCWALDNQLVYSSEASSPNFFQLPIVLCVGPRSCGLFPIQLGTHSSHLGGHNLLTTFIVSNLIFLLELASYPIRI